MKAVEWWSEAYSRGSGVLLRAASPPWPPSQETFPAAGLHYLGAGDRQAVAVGRPLLDPCLCRSPQFCGMLLGAVVGDLTQAGCRWGVGGVRMSFSAELPRVVTKRTIRSLGTVRANRGRSSQNIIRGKTTAAISFPHSLRSVRGAVVSAPLTWSAARSPTCTGRRRTPTG